MHVGRAVFLFFGVAEDDDRLAGESRPRRRKTKKQEGGNANRSISRLPLQGFCPKMVSVNDPLLREVSGLHRQFVSCGQSSLVGVEREEFLRPQMQCSGNVKDVKTPVPIGNGVLL